jgi:hypothetical protein
VPGVRKAIPGHSPFVPLPPIGMYTHCGPDALHMPSCKGFLSFLFLLDIVHQFSSWYGIHLIVNKHKATAYIRALESIFPKRERDDALRTRLFNITTEDRLVSSLSQDEPLPGGYLGTTLTAFFSPEAHLYWTKA